MVDWIILISKNKYRPIYEVSRRSTTFNVIIIINIYSLLFKMLAVWVCRSSHSFVVIIVWRSPIIAGSSIFATCLRQFGFDEVVDGGRDSHKVSTNVRSDALLYSKDIVSDGQNGLKGASDELQELLFSFNRTDVLQSISFLYCPVVGSLQILIYELGNKTGARLVERSPDSVDVGFQHGN
jgi:hypothetical protein